MPPYRNQPPYRGGGTPPSGGASSTPSSDYTRDVIARGAQAVRDRRDRLGYGSLDARQGLGVMAATGESTRPASSAFDDWVSSVMPQGYDVTFGRSEDGKYAGFKTEGELKAAIEGRAQGLRGQDQSIFDQLYTDAGQNLARATNDWSAGRREAQSAESDIRAQTGRDMGIVLPSSNESGVGYSTAGTNGAGSSDYSRSPGRAVPNDPAHLSGIAQAMVDQAPTMGERRGQQSAKLWQAEQPSWQAQNAQEDALGEWLAGASDRYLGQQEFAQQASEAPFSLYAARAGAEYGVDPNLLAGWFDPSGDVNDFQTQRNLDSIDAYGMPYSEYQSALTGLQSDAEQSMAEQTAAQEQAMNDVVFQVTGQDGGQLAAATNMTPDQLYQMVGDPNFQAYNADIVAATAAGDQQTASDLVAEILGQIGSDPAYLRLMTTLYPDIVDQVTGGGY